MDRRTLLQATSASAALFGAAPIVRSSTARARGLFNQSGINLNHDGPLDTESNDLTPYSGAWTDATLMHLLRRAMMGVPMDQFNTAKAMGSMSAVLDKLLTVPSMNNMPAINSSNQWELDGSIVDMIPSNYRSLIGDGMSDGQTVSANGNTLQNIRIIEVVNWWLSLILNENLSILEKMTLMWTNHFVTGSATVGREAYMYQYLKTCRANALGNFKNFVMTISVDPAMLVYLNGNQNYAKNVNENYARELMELFTLGILDPTVPQGQAPVPNYTENDVQAAAKALTGWQTLDTIDTTPGGTGTFSKLNTARQDTSTKTFLGQSGNWALADIINLIFNKQPYDANAPKGYITAYFACTKIYQAFAYYVPNTSVVDAMARLMVQNNFEIAPVVRALLSSTHFYDANVIGAQLKSPIEYVASLVRGFAVEIDVKTGTTPEFDATDPLTNASGTDWTQRLSFGDTNPYLSQMAGWTTALGQQLLNPPNVKGWPGGHNWLSTGTFTGRENYSARILTNGYYNKSSQTGIFFNQNSYAGQIPNGTSMTAKASDVLPLLWAESLAFTLGPVETNDLMPNPNATDVADGLIPGATGFAVSLAQLPEFQLY